MTQHRDPVAISNRLYPAHAIELACRAFAGLCTVEVDRATPDTVLTIMLAPGAPPRTKEEFLNYLLNAALESHLGAES